MHARPPALPTTCTPANAYTNRTSSCGAPPRSAIDLAPFIIFWPCRTVPARPWRRVGEDPTAPAAQADATQAHARSNVRIVRLSAPCRTFLKPQEKPGGIDGGVGGKCVPLIHKTFEINSFRTITCGHDLKTVFKLRFSRPWLARQPLHFGFFPRKLAGQANCALQQAHTRCGIVPHGAVGRCGLRQPVLRAACPHCGPILMTSYQCRIQCGNMERFCEMELLD